MTYNTLDDMGAVSLANAQEVRNFFLTALATYRAAIDSGSALKAQVRAASTEAEVDAVVDDR